MVLFEHRVSFTVKTLVFPSLVVPGSVCLCFLGDGNIWSLAKIQNAWSLAKIQNLTYMVGSGDDDVHALLPYWRLRCWGPSRSLGVAYGGGGFFMLCCSSLVISP